MSLEWFDFTPFAFNLALSLPGIVVSVFYALITVILLIRSLPSLRVTGSRVPLFGALIVLAPILAQVLILHFPSQPIWGMPAALLGLLPVLLAALILGTGPAIIVGLLTGLAWAIFSTGRITTQPFEIGLVGAALSWLVGQPYEGRIAYLARQPLIAMIMVGLGAGVPLSFIGVGSTSDASGLVSLDHAFSAFFPLLLTWAICSITAGLVAQGMMLLQPKWHRATQADLIAPPWERHLNQRVLFALVPMLIVAIVALVGLLSITAYQVATRQIINQMGRDAANAAESIPFFIQVGRSLIRDLAQDPALVEVNDESAEEHLSNGLRAVPFFQQLAYFDADGELVGLYPEDQIVDTELSEQERTRVQIALSEGAPTEVVLTPDATGSDVVMSFIAPIFAEDGESIRGALVGRTLLSANPILAPVIDILQSGFVGSGVGFIMDEHNRILLHPADPSRQQEIYNLVPTTEIALEEGDARAFRQREDDGTRDLIYTMPVPGRTDWSIVVTTPNEVVLALAVQIAVPMLLLLLLLTAIALPIIILVMRRITSRLDQLLAGVDTISQGDLTHAVQLTGQDEIGQLGQTFEQMRVRLKARLDEQERLLRVSRSVSGSLELFRAMPPILSSALEVSNASGVRVVVRQRPDDPPISYAAGEAAAVMAPLDQQLMELVEHQGTIVISQLSRIANSLDITALPPRIQGIFALPLRSDTSFHGIFWMAYDHEHDFEQPEMTFLSTLASQTAVAIANNKLFAEAEEERQKLETVLESTTDALLVTDQQGRIMLLNPAAEQFFGIVDYARGKRVEDVIDSPELTRLLTDLKEPVAALELPGPRGRVLLASISTMLSSEGAIMGRVAVMRDITALKELDNLKTVFLRMVSHDLRSPLTYMRGYLSMLPLTGDLNERQQEAIGKVTSGIDSISDLTERLLYLSRLQFGEEAELELSVVDVETMINEVLSQQEPLAAQNNVNVRVEADDRLPLLAADSMLYRHAVTNLVTNALKYSPEGGEVLIRAYQNSDTENTQITITVEDKGIGIRDEDQARLFEAFFRVPQRENDPPRPRGTGLGLALVKAIAVAHGGVVGVHSEFGSGSTFHITIPVRKPEEI